MREATRGIATATECRSTRSDPRTGRSATRHWIASPALNERNERAPGRLAWTLRSAVASAVILAACAGGKTAYTVSVAFNDRYTDDAGRAVETAVHDYDANADVLLQTSFPPIAHATVHTNDSGFCDAFRQRLMSRLEIASIGCEAHP